jgi:hypothetical protein
MVTPAQLTLETLGATAQFTAEAVDDEGAPIAGVAFSWSSSSTDIATVSTDGLATAIGNGQAALTATVEGSDVSGAAAVTVRQRPHQLVFATQPGDALPGLAMENDILVEVQDAGGTMVSDDGGRLVVMSIGSNPGGGRLAGTNLASVEAGVATFSGLSIDRPGSGYTLKAISTGLVEATCDAFDVLDSDRLSFGNANSEGEIGVLIDGAIGGSAVNDATHVTIPGTYIHPGNLTAAASNEIIAFQQRRPVTLRQDPGWTEGYESVSVRFADEMEIDVYVWLLVGPYQERYDQAVAAALSIDRIWHDERMGVRLGAYDITDKTSDQASVPYWDFTCDEAAAMRTEVGHQVGALNIYYVSRVDYGSGFSSNNGVWCGSNIIVMGSTAEDHLAVHEIGHAFDLGHVNALTENFDESNVMHNASDIRRYLTEGQIFRAHLEPWSVINTTYGLRSGLARRDCPDLSETASTECPAIQKRIWADGSFPPSSEQQTSVAAAVRAHLMQDCGTGDEDPARWLRTLAAYGEAAVPLLLAVVRDTSQVRGYRQRALNALAVIADPSSLDELREIAAQPDLEDDLRRHVWEVIGRIEARAEPGDPPP